VSGQQQAPAALYTPGKDSVPIVQEAGWAQGPVWTGGKSRPHRDSIPDRPVRSSVAIPTKLPGPHTHTHTHTHTQTHTHIYIYMLLNQREYEGRTEILETRKVFWSENMEGREHFFNVCVQAMLLIKFSVWK